MLASSDFSRLFAENLGPPVNLEAIVRGLGISLDKKADLGQDISGKIECDAGAYKISANRSEHYFRQRFTIAHELAHYLLHKDLLGEGVADNTAYRSVKVDNYINTRIGRQQEVEANKLAAAILMPAQRVREAFASTASLSSLAQQFQVSEPAMQIRLETLSLSF